MMPISANLSLAVLAAYFISITVIPNIFLLTGDIDADYTVADAMRELIGEI